ncbi:MAG TPA: RNA polymerase sigma factor [Longimicrobiales bacterium]|nr:RNA polymerase sigma factor [Longimicrobiales bacterium]
MAEGNAVGKPPSGAALEDLVAGAQGGSREALEALVRAVQGDVYGLALRFLWHPEDAEDATQEILVRVVTRLGSFEGRSGFRTWIYRVASNALLDMRRSRMEERGLTFVSFGQDLEEGLSDEALSVPPGVDEALLLEEVKIGCSLGMLLCLDRPKRLAYILGEILGLSHREAASVLQVSPAAYRQRLSRARRAVTDFMLARCGLVDPENPCRCRRRVSAAIDRRRVDPGRLLHATSARRAREFPGVLREIRALEEDRRAVALYRSHPAPEGRVDFVTRVRDLLDARP